MIGSRSKWKDFVVQLHKVGPGSFFVLFGTTILLISYFTGLSVEDIRKFGKDGTVETATRKVKYAASDDNPALNGSIVAINWAIELAQANDSTDTSDHRENIQKGRDYYKFARDKLLRERFGNPAYEAWKSYKSQISTPQSIPADMIEAVKNVDAATKNLSYQ